MREYIIRKLLEYFTLDFHIVNVSNNFLVNLVGYYLYLNYPWKPECTEIEVAYTRVPGDSLLEMPLFGMWRATASDPVPRLCSWWECPKWEPGQHYNREGDTVVTNILDVWNNPLFTSLLLGVSPTYSQLELDGTFMGLDPRRVMELPEDASVVELINSVAKYQKNTMYRHATGYVLPEDINQRVIEQGGMINVYQYPKF